MNSSRTEKKIKVLNTNKTETRFKPKRKARKPGKLGDGAGGGRGVRRRLKLKL